MKYARRSLQEVRTRLPDGVAKGHYSQTDIDDLLPTGSNADVGEPNPRPHRPPYPPQPRTHVPTMPYAACASPVRCFTMSPIMAFASPKSISVLGAK